MTVHIAIVLAKYADLILAGRKTMECRLSKVRCEPFGRVTKDDTIYFKVSGGPIVAAAHIDDVLSYDNLTPRAVQSLRERFNAQILGDDAYWQAKAASLAGTLLRLRDVHAPARVPIIPRRSPGSRKAWFCLTAPAFTRKPKLQTALSSSARP
jgi:ASC-1-like (ASCH) protein